MSELAGARESLGHERIGFEPHFLGLDHRTGVVDPELVPSKCRRGQPVEGEPSRLRGASKGLVRRPTVGPPGQLTGHGRGRRAGTDPLDDDRQVIKVASSSASRAI